MSLDATSKRPRCRGQSGPAAWAADVGALMIAELILHGWDLAAATDRVLALSGRDPAWRLPPIAATRDSGDRRPR
jgi:hypothetical protein